MPRVAAPAARGLPGLAACGEVEVGLGEGSRVLERDVVTGRGDDGAADLAGDLRELFGYFVAEIGLRANGQDRAADRVGVMRAVLLGVGWRARYISKMARLPAGCSAECTISSMSSSASALGSHICTNTC